MKPFPWLLVAMTGLSPLLWGGCSSPQKAYRDPLTYSFEAQPMSASATQSELQEVKEKVQETSKKIRSWENRYLW